MCWCQSPSGPIRNRSPGWSMQRVSSPTRLRSSLPRRFRTMLAPMRSRTKSLLACLIGVALAVPAIAQQSGSVTQYPTCPDPPPKLSKAELEAAGASYHVGVEAYDNGDYRKALDNIKDSFKRDCSKLALLEQLSLIYAALGDRAEAIHALETYLQRNPKAADADTVQNRIANLRALMQQSATVSATVTA